MNLTGYKRAKKNMGRMIKAEMKKPKMEQNHHKISRLLRAQGNCSRKIIEIKQKRADGTTKKN